MAIAVLGIMSALGAAPVLAVDYGGALTINAPTTVHDKAGTITIRARYHCDQYVAPYAGGTDLLIGGITSPATITGFDGVAAITCDGKSHQVTLTLTAFNGGLTGTAILQFVHQGTSPDPTVGGIAAIDPTLSSVVTVVQPRK